MLQWHARYDEYLGQICRKTESRLSVKFQPEALLQLFRQPIDNKSEIFKGLTKTHFYNINNNNN